MALELDTEEERASGNGLSDIGRLNIPQCSLPSSPKWEDGYDSLYRNPAVLDKAGVKVAFSSQSASMAKDLPYQAAKAAAFSLEKGEALKGVTIYPAQIFGVDDIMGSIKARFKSLNFLEGLLS